jgi:hypothetical protein
MASQSKRNAPEKPRPARSLAELLSLYDVGFVRCAYQTILGRDTDMSGLTHHTTKLRSGIAKMDVLISLRRSQEGRRVNYDLPWLDRAIRKRRREKIWGIGWVFRFFGSGEHDDPNSARLRAIENSLWRLSDNNVGRLEGIEAGIDRLQFVASRQGDALVEFLVKSGSAKRSDTEAVSAIARSIPVPVTRNAPQGLSLRASKFMRTLRAAQDTALSVRES